MDRCRPSVEVSAAIRRPGEMADTGAMRLITQRRLGAWSQFWSHSPMFNDVH
jgi:hypothetical protein